MKQEQSRVAVTVGGILLAIVVLSACRTSRSQGGGADPGPERAASGETFDAKGAENDESYFKALGFFERSVAAGRSGQNLAQLQEFEKCFQELDNTATISNFTYDRLRLMDAMATLCHKAGLENSWLKLRWQIEAKRDQLARSGWILSSAEPEGVSFEQLDRIAHTLPSRGEESTPLPVDDPREPLGTADESGRLADAGGKPTALPGLGEEDVRLEEPSKTSADPKGQVDDRLARSVDEAIKGGDLDVAADLLGPTLRREAESQNLPSAELFELQLKMARIELARNRLEEARSILDDLLAELERSGRVGGAAWYQASMLLSACYKLSGDYDRALEVDEERLERCSQTMDPEDPMLQEAEQDFLATGIALRGTSGSGALAWNSVNETASRGRDSADRAGTSASENRNSGVPFESDGGGGTEGDSQGAGVSLGGSESPTGEVEDGRNSGSPAEYEDRGAFDLAEKGYMALLERLRSDDPHAVSDRMKAREGAARCRDALGRSDEAAMLRRENLTECEEVYDEPDPRIQLARQALAQSHLSMGDMHGAIELQELACERLGESLPSDHPTLVEGRLLLSDLLEQIGETESALVVLEQVLSAEFSSAIDRERLLAMTRQVAAMYRECRLADAIELRRSMIETGDRVLPASSPIRIEFRRELAALLRVAGDRAAALVLESELHELGVSQALPGMRVRALESGSGTGDGAGYPPSVEMEVSRSRRGELLLTATVDVVAPVAGVSLVQDGELRSVELATPHWVPDEGGFGGRISIPLTVPTNRSLTMVSMQVEDACGFRAIETRSVLVGHGLE